MQQEGFEPPTSRFVAECSIQLSYYCIIIKLNIMTKISKLTNNAIITDIQKVTKKQNRIGSAFLTYGEPGGIRTPDPRLRRPLLYPTELLTHMEITASISILLCYIKLSVYGRGDRNRTCDLMVPNHALYQLSHTSK